MADSRTLERLRHAVAIHKGNAPPRPSSSLPPIEQILRGGWHETPEGPVFIRDDWYPLDHAHGALALGAPLEAAPAALEMLLGGQPPDPSALAFFDVETTGLSGGAGTRIFLAGLGTYEDGGFRLRQYFLADVSGERAMLGLLARDFARCAGVVTYNGRAFDVPCLQSRMTLARLHCAVGSLAHFDLLHAVRRLFRHRSPACRLSDAERRLLGLERCEDVPGWLIPSLYFDYVRAGRAAPLRAVFQHNAEDVLSLAGLLAALANLLSDRSPAPEDAVAVARWLERAGDGAGAMRLYAEALPWLEGDADWSWAAARYATMCRRTERRGEAAGLWRRLFDAGDERAGVDLAKHLEHHARDLPAAEEVTRALLLRCDARGRIALERRLARIIAKRHRPERSSGYRDGGAGHQRRTA